jgi:hypothetical protein
LAGPWAGRWDSALVDLSIRQEIDGIEYIENQINRNRWNAGIDGNRRKSPIGIENRKLKIENRKLKIENRKSKIENWKSKIENRKSKIENRHPVSIISLLVRGTRFGKSQFTSHGRGLRVWV